MENFHHRPIKRFSLDGNIHDESAIWRLKTEYTRLLISEMRLSGYVQRIDIDEDFTMSYNEKKKTFEFILSIYGIYVGKKQAECIMGIDGTKVMYIPQSKSSVSSQVQGSQLNQK